MQARSRMHIIDVQPLRRFRDTHPDLHHCWTETEGSQTCASSIVWGPLAFVRFYPILLFHSLEFVRFTCSHAFIRSCLSGFSHLVVLSPRICEVYPRDCFFPSFVRFFPSQCFVPPCLRGLSRLAPSLLVMQKLQLVLFILISHLQSSLLCRLSPVWGWGCVVISSSFSYMYQSNARAFLKFEYQQRISSLASRACIIHKLEPLRFVSGGRKRSLPFSNVMHKLEPLVLFFWHRAVLSALGFSFFSTRCAMRSQ
jgi:hypothetical protein